MSTSYSVSQNELKQVYELLPAPWIAEANNKWQLDISQVIDINGATIYVNPYSNMMTGDKITLSWQGEFGSPYILQNTVTREKRGKILTFIVPFPVLEQYPGSYVRLNYNITRATGELARSQPVDYYIIGERAKLLVIGARYSREGFYNFGATPPCYISALNANTLRPVLAEWQYAGEQKWVAGSNFQDVLPYRPLRVRLANQLVTLNPCNIAGNGWHAIGNGLGRDYTAAFVARRDSGYMVAWGDAGFGGNIPVPLTTLNNIVQIVSTVNAFAARLSSGHVVAWGSAEYGGVVPTEIAGLSDIVDIVGSLGAFAARRATGQVVAWGNRGHGGLVSPAIAAMTDIVDVWGAASAFVAQRATGHLVAWGSSDKGGALPPEVAAMTDIVEIVKAAWAFAVRRANNSVVAWGYGSDFGSVVPGEISALRDIIKLSSSNNAFAALRANGSVVAWGRDSFGGVVPKNIAGLNDIVEVTATVHAFTARRANGSVVAWGMLIGEEKFQNLSQICK
ncbi:hypothetical protein C6H69_01920, partial [Photorhabdus luminescens]